MAKKIIAASGVSLFLFLAIVIFVALSDRILTRMGTAVEPPGGYDLSSEFEQAEQYAGQGNYRDAEVIYQAIITDYPGTDEALSAQEMLTILYITWGRQQEAGAALDELATTYYENDGVAEAVDHVADKYRDIGQFAMARDTYQYVVDTWPQAEHAVNSQVAAVLSGVLLLVQSGDDEAADQALDDLINDFSGYADIAGVVDGVADEYRGFGRYEKARDIYQYVADTWPQAEHADESQMGAILSDSLRLMELGDDVGVHQNVDTLITGFNDHPALSRVVFQVGEGYYTSALAYQTEGLANDAQVLLGEAAAVWERITGELPLSANAARASYFCAVCYESTGAYADAAELYESVSSDWPDYRFAWNALFKVGYSYEALKKSGSVSMAEADMRIKAAYEQLLEDYPNCKAARHARRWLSRHDSI
jgi:TolA-binding protein